MQNQEQCWQQQRKNEASLRAMVKKYNEQCPATGDARKRGVFNTVRYKEELAAKTAVVNNDVGEMMHKSRFVAWAQTHQNPEGVMTATLAADRWMETEAAAQLGERLRNSNGLAKEPLQLRIRVSSQVIF